MDRRDIAKAFIDLGAFLRDERNLKEGDLLAAVHNENVWFTADNVIKSLSALGDMLEEDKLTSWLKDYPNDGIKEESVGLVLAGNIPAVGFHDLLCVLLSGYKAEIKLSSQDTVCMKFIIHKLIDLYPALEYRIEIKDKLDIANLSGVIATGSNNTSRYFEQYFSKVPNIIRKNRTSVAVLTGGESEEELMALGTDILLYFGLGCRNVSKLFVPTGYKFDEFYRSIESFSGVIQNSRYSNNYDYNKSIYLVNGVEHFDNGFLIIAKNDELVSPISVVYYEEYNGINELNNRLNKYEDAVQCVAGNKQGFVPFGRTQAPEIDDYADGVDTMGFLGSLNVKS